MAALYCGGHTGESSSVLPQQARPKFYQELEQLEFIAAQPGYANDKLSAKLDDIYARVANANFSSYEIADLAKAAPELMYRLFDVRMVLRSGADTWRESGFMTAQMAAKLRDCLRILRYVTDMLGEISTHNLKPPSPNAPVRRAFTGAERSTLVNWKFYTGRELAFRSGDVVLMRGHMHNSAAIARIGDVDSQFSHIGIIYIDDNGQHFMVESLIEDGAVINPLAHTFEHGIVRAVLYRHRDPRLAARAARLIHDHVAQARRPILYDFSMNLEGGRHLFCSKLVCLAYKMASEGKLKLPTYPTHIVMKNRDFLNRIGVVAVETCAPADIDVEPHFDLVAEWQDYRETSNIRLQDFTMDKLFQWMEADGYVFEETALVRLVSIFGRFAAHLSNGAKELIASTIPKVPINMPRKTVAAVAMLHKTAEPIFHELQALERASVAKNGRPLIGVEIYEALEAIRARSGGRIGYLVRPG